MENNCFVTLMTNDSFFPCIKRNAEILKITNPNVSFYVMIPKDNIYLINLLNKYNIKYKEINIDTFKNDGSNYYFETINKFQIFNFSNYDKVCFIDADLFIIQDFSDEFKKLDTTDIILYTEEQEKISGQIIIVKPDKEKYQKLKNMANQYVHDEELLNDIYKDKIKDLEHLPGDKIIHFGGLIKPWSYQTAGYKDLKNFFNNDNISTETILNTFYNHLDNFRGLLYLWDKMYKPNRCIYIIFIENKESVKEALLFRNKMENYGIIYPILFILDKNEKYGDISFLDQDHICFHFCEFKHKNLSIIEQTSLILRLFRDEGEKFCIIKPFDDLNENFDLIFSKNVSKDIQKQFLNKYKNNLFYFEK